MKFTILVITAIGDDGKEGVNFSYDSLIIYFFSLSVERE